MRYWTLAAVSSLSAFALFVVAGSILARAGAAVLGSRLERHAPASRARLLFRLRILPGVCAAIAAFGVALPVFVWFEEAGTTESVSRTLGLIAAAGAFLIGLGVWRAATAWRATAQVLAAWRRSSRPLDGFDAPLPAFAIEHAFPVVAVVGILRPRLFVAECVLRECSPAEVAAMIAHEWAHVSARDNLRRLLIRMCPDALGVAPRLDRAWSAAAEEAADARAAGQDAHARLDLAGALIHVARLAAPQAPPLASAFYLGGSVEDRVRRLVEPAVDAAASPWSRVAAPGAIALLAIAILLAAPTVHALMEQAVRLLP